MVVSMTENDPNAREESGVQASSATGEQTESSAAESGQAEQSELSTPPRGNTLGAGQPYAPPNPWSSQAQQGAPAYGQHVQPGVHASQYGTAVYPMAPPLPQQNRTRAGSGRLIAGVAVLALLVGGGAGAAGGYLAAGGTTGSLAINALDAPTSAQQSANAAPGSVEAVASKLLPSVVELQVSGSGGAGEGSGFVLSTDGYILTNNHVVEVAASGGTIEAVFHDGKKAAAKVVGRDPTTDIAVVKVDGLSGLTPVELGRSGDMQVGQAVVAIGSPFELAGTVTSGIVSALHRPVRAGGSNGDQTTVMDAMQTDAAINPGNSGGPLANTAGQVIGINSAIYSPQSSSGMQSSQGGNVGIGFAIPIDQARRTANDIIKTGQAVQTFIGAQVQDAPSGGALLGAITPGSPAEKAGLKAGDVVTMIDGGAIDNSDALVAAIRTRAPNEVVKLTLADSRVITVTLGGQPVKLN
jgi:putative serine protease PepD